MSWSVSCPTRHLAPSWQLLTEQVKIKKSVEGEVVSKLRLLCRYVFRPWGAGEDEPETARHVCFIAEIQIVVRGSLGY